MDADDGMRPGSGPGTVLVVDDDDAVRGLIEAVLADSGFVVISAEDAGAAREQAARYEGDIDVLVTDVRMTTTSGPELAELLRTQNAQLGVLFVSGLPDNDALRACAEREDTELLRKPFSPAQMVLRVARLVPRTPS